jgi:hypothetical protein
VLVECQNPECRFKLTLEPYDDDLLLQLESHTLTLHCPECEHKWIPQPDRQDTMAAAIRAMRG